MPGRQVTESFAVSPQITTSDVEAIKAAGFRSILCNRPDGEELGQPTYHEIEAAAKASGLEIRHQPVTGGPTQADVQAFSALAGELPSPIFAYCKSGTRCIMLWALAESQERPVAEVLDLARQAGYDLRG